MTEGGGGVRKSPNLHDVIYKWPLRAKYSMVNYLLIGSQIYTLFNFQYKNTQFKYWAGSERPIDNSGMGTFINEVTKVGRGFNTFVTLEKCK